MKLTFALLALVLSITANAAGSIMPQPSTQAPVNPIVSCHVLSTELDITDLYVVAAQPGNGDLIVKQNTSLDNGPDSVSSPYLVYNDLALDVNSETLNVSGTITTMGGEVPINISLQRHKTAQVNLMGMMPATCITE